jgi:hypothetical protein
MLAAALLASLAICSPAPTSAPPPPRAAAADSLLLGLYSQGVTFAEFVDKAQARREGWLRLQRDAAIAPELIARARAVGGDWKLLIVARDACGDSMNSVPYAARLADLVPGLNVRIVTLDVGAAAAASYQTMDRRSATPTLILLDAAGTAVGCIVELPAPLRHWTDKARATVGSDSLHAYRTAFYTKDKGNSMSTELVEMLEAARRGTPHCERAPAR